MQEGLFRGCVATTISSKNDILGLYRDNGKENGSYYILGLYRVIRILPPLSTCQ